MDDFGGYDWSVGTSGDHQEKMRSLSPKQLRHVARIYDWRLHPEEALGWVMAQKCMDLSSALSAFMNGEPERFNYMPKRDVPDQYHAAARVLDNICLRVNSGFYLSNPDTSVDNERRLARWLKYQDVDRSEGRRGRWILDEGIIAGLTEKLELPDTVAIPENPKNSLLHDVLSPLKDLGVSRDHLKYLPAEYDV